MATLAELQSVLKSMKEADESEQENSSNLKQKPRFDCNKTIEQEGTEFFARKTAIITIGKTVLKAYRNKKRGKEIHAIGERQRDSSREREVTFEDRY